MNQYDHLLKEIPIWEIENIKIGNYRISGNYRFTEVAITDLLKDNTRISRLAITDLQSDDKVLIKRLTNPKIKSRKFH